MNMTNTDPATPAEPMTAEPAPVIMTPAEPVAMTATQTPAQTATPAGPLAPQTLMDRVMLSTSARAIVDVHGLLKAFDACKYDENGHLKPIITFRTPTLDKWAEIFGAFTTTVGLANGTTPDEAEFFQAVTAHGFHKIYGAGGTAGMKGFNLARAWLGLARERTSAPRAPRAPKAEPTPTPAEPAPAPVVAPRPAPAVKSGFHLNGTRRLKCGEDVDQLLALNLNVMLYGEPGNGKTEELYQTAVDNGWKICVIPALRDVYTLIGYNDGMGRFVETEFLKAYTSQEDTLIIFDELDRCDPTCPQVIYSALANGRVGTVHGDYIRGPRVRICATGNTCGNGGSTRGGIIADEMDEALRNRFVMLHVGYERTIDMDICQDEELVQFIEALRRGAVGNASKFTVSYRTESQLKKCISVFGGEGAGLTRAIDASVTKGLPKESIENITHAFSPEESVNKYCQAFGKCARLPQYQ